MKRAVRSVICLIAAGLTFFGTLEICLEIANHLAQVRKNIEPTQTNVWRYIIGAVLIVVGAILFLGSESLAEQLTDEPDEPDEPDDTKDGHTNDTDETDK